MTNTQLQNNSKDNNTRATWLTILRTFFFPLLELAAAKALASFEACTFGACKKQSRLELHRRQCNLARGQRAILTAQQAHSQDLTMTQGSDLAPDAGTTQRGRALRRRFATCFTNPEN